MSNTYQSVLDTLSEQIDSANIGTDVALAPLTTFKIGGRAALLVRLSRLGSGLSHR